VLLRTLVTNDTDDVSILLTEANGLRVGISIGGEEVTLLVAVEPCAGVLVMTD
jgi:hypothetical protein